MHRVYGYVFRSYSPITHVPSVLRPGSRPVDGALWRSQRIVRWPRLHRSIGPVDIVERVSTFGALVIRVMLLDVVTVTTTTRHQQADEQRQDLNYGAKRGADPQAELTAWNEGSLASVRHG